MVEQFAIIFVKSCRLDIDDAINDTINVGPDSANGSRGLSRKGGSDAPRTVRRTQ
jgi:hypothetical protein